MKSMNTIDTPALLVDLTLVRKNIAAMQEKADRTGVNLRPHTKTHRTPALAAMQVTAGASGITVAKIAEAEVMQAAGLEDIFIASVVMGEQKMQRLHALAGKGTISIGVDNEAQVAALAKTFEDSPEPLDVLIEIETGEERTGVLTPAEAVRLARLITEAPGLRLKGVFSHEGFTYGASSVDECKSMAEQSQRETLAAANAIRQAGMLVDVVSIGATPSLLLGGVIPGITEIRPGTYILMDAAQGAAVGSFDSCAATVLATVTSKTAPVRVVLDTGVKALTAFVRTKGMCATPGHGIIRELDSAVRVTKLYDEHGIINDQTAFAALQLGDRVHVIPNHICPTCNLYDTMYIIEDGEIVDEYPILCRGKSQ